MIVACESLNEDNGAESEAPGELQRAEVVRVVDGDTIVVRVDGREERLRYIGIDAPESVQPDAPIECFGPEASQANEDLVAGQSVWLEADEENRDRFGRLLRYVYVEVNGARTMLNLYLVERGYAEAGNYLPNDRYENRLFNAEATAQARGAGLWSACR